MLGRDRVFDELTSDENDGSLIALANDAAAAYRRYRSPGT
jgi:hypothetical protein